MGDARYDRGVTRTRLRPLPRAAVLALAAAALAPAPPALLTLPAARAGDGAAAGDAPGAEVFFRDPDRATAQRIEALMSQFTADGVQSRRKARVELADLGWWTVEPLLVTLREKDPPARGAAILTLDALGDQRALPALRESVVREDSNAYVGAFAALALGRFRDTQAIGPLRKALQNTRNLDMLRAAVPLALARIRTPEAEAQLRVQLEDRSAVEPVASARYLAAGFFPELALAKGGGQPGAPLQTGLASTRRGERQAALLAFLVATARTTAGKDFLVQFADNEDAPTVLAVALLGLAAFPDSDVTERLAKTAASGAPDGIRELACDLLVPRADATTLPTLLKILRSPAGARLRARALLAAGRIDAKEARDAILDRMTDKAPLVRAAAAVAAATSSSDALRAAARQKIDGRMAGGESDAKVRDLLQIARQVLAGDRTAVAWPEVSPEPFFASVAQSQRMRLIRAVNRRVELSLDLGKITNLQSDDQLIADSTPGVLNGFDPRTGGTVEGVPSEDNPGGGPNVGQVPRSPMGSMGSSRTSDWPELRDLLLELAHRPYFSTDDFPVPLAAPTAPGDKADGAK